MSGRPASARGRLIALEGIDGCGKSTQSVALAGALGALVTFEPGATVLGQTLRSLVLHPGPDAPVPRAEALLMAADRAQHVATVIEPALAEGQWVVTDRYSGSTLAYQGWGRGLGTDGLDQVCRWATGGTEPDLSVLLDLPVPEARRRLDVSGSDRLESLDVGFHQEVRRGFLALAQGDPHRWEVVDASGGPDEVTAAVVRVVRQRLARP